MIWDLLALLGGFLLGSATMKFYILRHLNRSLPKIAAEIAYELKKEGFIR